MAPLDAKMRSFRRWLAGQAGAIDEIAEVGYTE